MPEPCSVIIFLYGVHIHTRFAYTGITTVAVLFETVFAEQRTHDRRASVADTDITAVVVCLEAVLAEHGAHDRWALFALTEIATVGIGLESIRTEHSASLL